MQAETAAARALLVEMMADVDDEIGELYLMEKEVTNTRNGIRLNPVMRHIYSPNESEFIYMFSFNFASTFCKVHEA